MVCPKAYFHSLEGVSYNQSHNISLLLEGVGVLIGNFLLNILNNAYNIYHFALDPLIFVLPTVILIFVLGFDDLVLYLLNSIVFFSEPDLWTPFDLVSLKKLEPFYVIDLPSFQLP